jgi:hypothetical protein
MQTVPTWADIWPVADACFARAIFFQDFAREFAPDQKLKTGILVFQGVP